ncbi:hypothetical protein [Sorangium sp. So ce887]|uniref:hypothetical protein n=1 Tax=Sorangium sp. So ce887 TaxID=3133324 RepID=UPI003F5F0112
MASKFKSKFLDSMKAVASKTIDNLVIKNGSYKPSGSRAWMRCSDEPMPEIVNHAIQNAQDDDLEDNGEDAMRRRKFTLKSKTSSGHPITVEGSVGESDIEIDSVED